MMQIFFKLVTKLIFAHLGAFFRFLYSKIKKDKKKYISFLSSEGDAVPEIYKSKMIGLMIVITCILIIYFLFM